MNIKYASNFKYASEFAREFIKNHPEHKEKVLDYYSLMKDRISEAGSNAREYIKNYPEHTDHEIELFIGSCNDLLKKDNLSESGGGVYKGGGGVGKMYYHIIEYGQYDNIGYQGYYDTIEEAQKQVEKLSNYFPNQTFEIFADKSRKEPPITTMAKGGGVEKANAGYLLIAEKLKNLAPKSFDSADEKLSEQIKNNNMYAKGNTVKSGQFDRDKNGSLYDRGSSDSWYGRGKNPHWYPEGTYHGYPITKDFLTKEEIEEYNKGYDFNESEGGRKEYAKGTTIGGGVGDTIADRYARLTEKEAKRLDELSKKVRINEQTDAEDIEWDKLVHKYRGWDYKGYGNYAKGTTIGGGVEKANAGYLLIAEKLKNLAPKSFDSADEKLSEQIKNNNMFAKGNTVKDKYRLTQQEVLDRGEINDSWSSDDGGSNQSEDLEIIFEDKTYLIIVEFGERKKAKYPNMKATPVEEYAKGNTVKGGEYKFGYDITLKKHTSKNGTDIELRQDPKTKYYAIFINGFGGASTEFLHVAEDDYKYELSKYELSEKQGFYAKGGGVGDENREMVLNNNKQIRHHTEELHQILKKDKAEVPAWVVSKVGRATTDLSDATHYLEGSIEKAANGMKIGTGYSDTFKDFIDLDNQTYFIRNWGYVGTDKFDKIELVAVATIMDLKGYVSEDELSKDGNFELSITIVPTEKFISKKHKESANDDNSSISSNSIINIVNYMGGLNYSTQDKFNFKTFEDAKKYLMSKELNDKISAEGRMSGFVMDKQYNRAGQKNWDYLAYMTGESDKFVDGGGVSKYKKGGPVKDYTGTDFSKLIDDLKVFLIKYPYIWKKDGKSYVPIEGWQFAAALMGYTTRVVSVNEIENGYMSMAEVIDQDGKVVGSGFGLVTKDEAKWANSQKYELASFSQTRAVSRALRNCISWVIKAAGYKTTPAEEMYGVGSSKMQNMPKYNAPATPKTIVQYPSMTPIKAPMTPPMTTEEPMPDAFEEMADMLRPQKSPMAKNPDFKYKDILRDLYSQAVAYSIVLISPKFMSDVEESLLVDDNDLHYTMLERAYLYLLDNNIVLKTTRYMTKLRKIVNGENFAYGGLLKELPIEIYNAIVESGHQNDIISFDIEPFNSNGDRDKTINVEGVDYYISTKINSEEIANDLNNNTSLNHNYYIADIGGNELLISNN